MGGQPATVSKPSFPANSFDIEISDKQKIESLIYSIMRDHLVISKSWLKGCVRMQEHIMNQRKDTCAVHIGAVKTQWDLTVMNSESFIFSHLAVSHQKRLARSL